MDGEWFGWGMKNLLITTISLFLLSCGSSEVVRMGPNLYIISGSTALNSSKVKTEMFTKANKFAAERGKIAEKVSLREEHPEIGAGGQYEYQFRLVDDEQ